MGGLPRVTLELEVGGGDASGRVIVTIPTSAAAPVGFTPKEFRLPAISPRISVVR